MGECASSKYKLKEFKIYFHNDCDSFKSLAVCYRETTNFKFLDSLPGMIVFSVSKSTFSSEALKFILLYRKNMLSNIDFACMIDHMLSRYPDIDIIAGDFNEDGFNMPGNLSSKLLNYEQIVKEPTQIDGRMIDQIYISKNVPFVKTCIIKHIHFSDHDATTCKFEIIK